MMGAKPFLRPAQRERLWKRQPENNRRLREQYKGERARPLLTVSALQAA